MVAINPIGAPSVSTVAAIKNDRGETAAPQRIALIIDGDEDSKLKQIHQQNVEDAVNRLKTEEFDQIFVLAPNQPKKEVTYYNKPTPENIRLIMTRLKQMKRSDSLFLYTTGHGDYISSLKQACLKLPDKCVTEQELTDYLNGLPANNQTIVMDQCYGGSWVDRMSAPNRMLIANTRKEEGGFCRDFASAFWSDKFPDPNGDKIITIQERMETAAEAQAGENLTFSVGTDYSDRGLGQIAGKPLYPDTLTEVKGAADFDQKLSLYPHGVTVAFFSAKHCPPCRELKPKVIALAGEYAGRVQFLYLDEENNRELIDRYNIGRYPTVKIIKAGSFSPVPDPDDLRSEIDAILLAQTTQPSPSLGTIKGELKSTSVKMRIQALKNLAHYIKTHPDFKDPGLIDHLIKDLNSADPGLMLNAIHLLSYLKIKDNRIIKPLSRALDSRDIRLRLTATAAVRELQLQDERFIGPLLESVKSDNLYLKEIAIQAIGAIRLPDRKLIAPLLAVLNSNNLLLRQSALETVGRLGIEDGIFIEPLLKALKSNEPALQKEAAYAIGHLQFNDQRFIDPLFALLVNGQSYNSTDMKAAAIYAIGRLKINDERMADRLFDALNVSHGSLIEYVAEALSELGIKDQRFAEPLVNYFSRYYDSIDNTSALIAVTNSIVALGIKDERIVDPLVQMISGKNADSMKSQAASKAIKDLGLTNERSLIYEFTYQLEHGTREQKREIMNAIGDLGIKNDEVTEAIIKAVNSGERDDFLLERAAFAFKYIGAKEVRIVNILLSALNSDYPQTMQLAVDSLSELGIKDRLITVILLNALHSKDAELRLRGAWAIRKLNVKDASFIAPLKKELHSSNKQLRRLAKKALDFLTAKPPQEN